MNKIMSIILVMIMLLGYKAQAQNQKIQKVQFSVSGNCSMCKERIEKAAMIKGVKEAIWDKKTKELNVVFNSLRTNPELIKESIVQTGHTTDDKKASKSRYDQLPECCKYDDHPSH